MLRALITEKGGEEDTMSVVISPLDEVIKTYTVFSTILFELSAGFVCLFVLCSHLATGNKLGWEMSETELFPVIYIV